MRKTIVFMSVLLLACMTGCGTDAGSAGNAAETDSLAMLSEAVSSMALPLEVSSDLSVDSAAVSEIDSLLSMWITIDDDLIDSAAVVSEERVQKTIIGMLGEAASVDSMLAISRQSGVGLHIEVGGRTYRPRLSFDLPPARWRAMRPEKPEVRDVDEIKVRNRVSSDNRECPYEIEDGVVLLGMSVMDRYVTFRTEIDVDKLDFMMMKENRDSLNHGVVEFLRQQLGDSLQRRSLIDISDARFGYRNRYIASDRKDSFDISFTPADLQRLIQTTDSMCRRRTSINNQSTRMNSENGYK